MRGCLFAVVGPSGAGKDALICAAAAADPGLARVRRVITRPASAGGEDFEGVTEPVFRDRLAAGAFAIHWTAHGLCYAIPGGMDAQLAAGRTLLFNCSRGALMQALVQYPALRVLQITAPVGIRAARLAARGRETSAQISARLSRVAPCVPEGLLSATIDNSGTLDTATKAFLAAVHAESGARVIS